MSFVSFIDRKTQLSGSHGFIPTELPSFLFPFQIDLVTWALAKGRAALFADCGLGKTPMQLVWADQVHQRSGRPVLIVTPLAVTFQTETESDKFGIEASISRTGRPTAPITITNYDRLHLFEPADFGGMVCDESAAIKSFDSERRALVTDFMRKLPYRLLCTATAAPNDYIELGTSAEALGELGYADMLSRFFTNKESTWVAAFGGRGDKFRFKGHAEEAFWRWVASWARVLRRPSDLGYDDNGFQLPELQYRRRIIDSREPAPGQLFDLPAFGLKEQRQELRRTIEERIEAAADLLSDADPGIAWCHLNQEGDLLTKLIKGAVQVKGSDPIEQKEEALDQFSRGKIRVLVTKPSIAGWGLNWQHCHRMTYFPSHSYEQFYQSVRRCWRFGQQSTVLVDIITTEGGLDILANLEAKSERADRMFDALTRHMRDALSVDSIKYPDPVEVPSWLS